MNTNLNEIYEYHHYRHEELVQEADQHRMVNANDQSRPSLVDGALCRTGTLLTTVGIALIQRYGESAYVPQPATKPRIESL